ncbi:MAG: M23 family metallopeptidase [Microbacteriaceae bacterium]
MRSRGPLAATAAAGGLLFSLVLGIPLALTGPEAPAAAQGCAIGGPAVAGPDVDDPRLAGLDVAGYSGDQLVNASIIMAVGHERDLSVRDQTIAVMTAMGESGLRVLDRGDAVGPDSRGLFQQRDNGAWGTYEDRMDPARSAGMFYDVLVTVDGREGMTPSYAAHRVQRNADPDHYTRYWPAAQQIVAALADVDLDELTASAGSAEHCATTPGELSAEGWTHPLGTASYRFTSPYGVPRYGSTHSGVDLAAPDGTPIYAVQDGIVTIAGESSGGNSGFMVAVDHGEGVQSRYVHSWSDAIYVSVGQEVQAGDHIADVGSSGNSTGPHLHFEIRINATPTEPVAYMAGLGIDIS